MAGAVVPQPSAFDYYPIALQQQQRQQMDVSNLSPVSLYSPQLQADLGTDSAASPDSPTSPVFTSPYQLPTSDDWLNWEDDASKPVDFFKTEPFDSDFASAPPRTLASSPAINPMDLSKAGAADDVPFGREGLNDTQPLFSNPIPGASEAPSPATAAPVAVASRQQGGSYMPSAAAMKISPSASSRHISDPPSPGYPSSRKRKSSSSDSPDSQSTRSSTSPPPPMPNSHRRRISSNNNNNGASAAAATPAAAPKKTAHNMIEKRYRTNLNDKIAALRDSVPALRVMVHRLESSQHGGAGPQRGSSEEADGEDVVGVGMTAPGEEDLGGLAPAHKLNKATILSKATEYIAHLERRNRNLAKENAALRSRVEGFEMLVMSRGGTGGVWS